jgi:hypothetical protein
MQQFEQNHLSCLFADMWLTNAITREIMDSVVLVKEDDFFVLLARI